MLEFSIAFCANTVQWGRTILWCPPAKASRDFALPRGAEDADLLTATHEIMNVVAAIPTIYGCCMIQYMACLTTGLKLGHLFSNISGALLKIVTLVAADVTG